MKNVTKGSIKLLVISFIISLLISMLSNFSISIFFYMFVYFLSFIILPNWLRNNDVKAGIKLLIIIIVGLISTSTITYFYGIGRVFHRYTISYCVGYTFFYAVNFISKKYKARFH